MEYRKLHQGSYNIFNDRTNRGHSIEEYFDIRTFQELKEIQIYYKDTEKMELFLGMLIYNADHGNNLKLISIHTDFSQISMENLDKTTPENEDMFQEIKYYYSRRNITLQRIPLNRLNNLLSLEQL